MPWCSRATTTNVSRTRRRRPRIGEGRLARGRHRNTVAAFFMSRRNARNTDRTTMESERKRSRRTRTAPPRSASMHARRSREVSGRRASRRWIRARAQDSCRDRARRLLAPRHNFECHADMPTSLRKQLVDRRRVVHGIAIGREQILLIAENNLYGRDGIRAVSDLQQMSSVPFVAKETRDSRNADGITASDDRCKPV